ncbi:hypothetical protein [Nocardia brasiliensis]|uniref:hypothetical protein n=1 Tax=Nocardia brasiliensis TaxID=37326 RepID=UPI002456200C|nr:hypothetical protein [Nocardia brasiliensis]
MSTTGFLSAGIWPLLIFMSVVLFVTLTALILAPAKDVARIFEAFAAAFGIRKVSGSPTAPGVEGNNADTAPAVEPANSVDTGMTSEPELGSGAESSGDAGAEEDAQQCETQEEI